VTSISAWPKGTRSATLRVERAGAVGVIELNRPAKRNALNNEAVETLRSTFESLPTDIRAVVIHGAGDHFCAGLDLSEAVDWSLLDGLADSRVWRGAFEAIERAAVPIVFALHGAVIGGGMELAATGHVRVADETAFFALPEGQRGLFLGGGGSVRLPRLIGTARVMDLMLTGRTYDAHAAEQSGLVHYVVEPGAARGKALEIAQTIATNAPLSNYAIIAALPHIVESSPQAGLFTETLMAAIAQSDPEAKHRLTAFLEKRAARVRPA